MNNHMYEHPATQANLAHAARARRADRRARRRAAGLQGRAGRRAPGRAGASCWRRASGARRALRAGARSRARRSPTGEGAGRACACWSPPAARASRSTACASSATAPPGAWASRSREAARARGARGDADRRQRRAAGARRASRARDVATAAELQQACEQEFPACDVLLMAAAVADFRPAEPGRRARSRRPGASACELELEPTADVLAGSRPRSAAPARRSSGSPPSTASGRSRTARGKLAAKGLDAVVVNDISRADIGFDVGRQRGHDPHRADGDGTAARAASSDRRARSSTQAQQVAERDPRRRRARCASGGLK